MGWQYRRLRGARVLARCDDAGELRPQGARVEIRYRSDDGRAYFAAPRNLEPDADETIYPDDWCGEATRAQGSTPPSATRRAKHENKQSSQDPPPQKPAAGETLVYADGACSGNPGPAGVGVVALRDDARWELSEYLGEATNNVAELTGILRATEVLEDSTQPLRIYTDSSYAIGVLVRGWKAKANTELVRRVRDALSQLEDVEIHHVPGHAGIPLNERADALAREAIDRRQTRGWRSGAER